MAAAVWLRIGVIVLLLPYFLSGLSLVLMHAPKGPSRRWWAAAVALILVLFLPSIAIFIAIGLFYPLKGRSLIQDTMGQ
jgi:hypothetical protein